MRRKFKVTSIVHSELGRGDDLVLSRLSSYHTLVQGQPRKALLLSVKKDSRKHTMKPGVEFVKTLKRVGPPPTPVDIVRMLKP